MNINEKILFEKDDFRFSKKGNNIYYTTFTLENHKIDLTSVINFELIKLIYDLNPDIYETVILEKINENEANITLVMKHFFEDLGLPQKFAFLHMKKIMAKNHILFEAQTIRSYIPEGISDNIELIAIDKIDCLCEIVNPHKVIFMYTIFIDDVCHVPTFVEKMMGILTNKICKRVKQFIENVTI